MMFESVFTDDAASRLRAAGVPPLAAFLIALGYLTIYPLLGRVPAPLFWSIVVILAAGAVIGAVRIIRIVRRERIRGRAIGWLVAASAITLVCAKLAQSMAVPWL